MPDFNTEIERNLFFAENRLVGFNTEREVSIREKINKA